jgi:hypothetical protein
VQPAERTPVRRVRQERSHAVGVEDSEAAGGRGRRSRMRHSHDVPELKPLARKARICVGSAEPDSAHIGPAGRLTHFHATAHESMNR